MTEESHKRVFLSGCPIPSEILQQYLEGFLDGLLQARVELHLSQCTSCREELESLRELCLWLEETDIEVPESLLGQIVEKVEEQAVFVERARGLSASLALGGQTLSALGDGLRWSGMGFSSSLGPLRHLSPSAGAGQGAGDSLDLWRNLSLPPGADDSSPGASLSLEFLRYLPRPGGGKSEEPPAPRPPLWQRAGRSMARRLWKKKPEEPPAPPPLWQRAGRSMARRLWKKMVA